MKNKKLILSIFLFISKTFSETSFNIDWQADTIRLHMDQMLCQKFMADSIPVCNLIVQKKYYQTIFEGLCSKAYIVNESYCCGESKNAYLELITTHRGPIFIYIPWPCNLDNGLIYMDSCYLRVDFNKKLVVLIDKLYKENMKMVETPNGMHSRAMKCMDSIKLLEPFVKHINSFSPLVIDSIERPSKYGIDKPRNTDLLKLIDKLKTHVLSSNLILHWDTLSMKYNIELPAGLEAYVPENNKQNFK